MTRPFFSMRKREIGVAVKIPLLSLLCLSHYFKEIITDSDGSIYPCISGIGYDKLEICTYHEGMNQPEKFLTRLILAHASLKGERCRRCDFYALCNGGCKYECTISGQNSSCQFGKFRENIDAMVEIAFLTEEIEPYIYRKTKNV